MNKTNLFLAIAGSVALIIVVMMIVLSGNNSDVKGQQTVEYKKDDQNRPIAVLAQNKIDWGQIKESDTQESEIEFNNDGESPLKITKLSTSCGCTAVKVINNGTESKEYSMHRALEEDITIAPKTTAKLKVIYRPYTMPVEGPVTRQVFIETNDPNNQNLEIAATATVSK